MNIERKSQVAPIAAVTSEVNAMAGSSTARRPRLSESQPPIQLLKAQVIEVPENQQAGLPERHFELGAR